MWRIYVQRVPWFLLKQNVFLSCCVNYKIIYVLSLQISEGNNLDQAGNFQKTKRQIVIYHTDIIGDSFWIEHPDILKS